MAPAWATRHNDWRVWVGVFCCLAALQYFIFFICSVSYDSWRTPNEQKSPQPTVAWPQPFPASEVARGKDRQPTSRPSCEPGEPCLDRQSQEEVFRRRFGVENPCNLTDQFTFSALSRASTLACRKELVSVACKAKMGTLFPTSLQTECRIESGFKKGQSLGCFQDSNTSRIFKNGRRAMAQSSVKMCLEYCLQGGFRFAGLQYGSECWCSTPEPPSSSRVSNHLCDMPCPGAPNEFCGGYFTMSVFATGFPLIPIRPPRPPVLARHQRNPKCTSNRCDSLPPSSSLGIVFLMTVNGRQVRQIHRLIKALVHPQHYFFIHVDSRHEYLRQQLTQLEPLFRGHLWVSRHPTPSMWGGASLLDALLSSMLTVLQEFSHWKWDFIVNLSETDYLIRPVEELRRFLLANRGYSLLKSSGINPHRFLRKQGLHFVFHQCDDHMWRLEGDRADLVQGIPFDGGSDWMALARNFVEYLLIRGRESALVNGLLEFYHHKLLPAESFFHTALMNSPLCGTRLNANLHLSNWDRKRGCQCQQRRMVDWCGCSPLVFRMEDYSKIRSEVHRNEQSQSTMPPRFFARKFNPTVDSNVLAAVDEINGVVKEKDEIPSLIYFWENAYHFAVPDGNQFFLHTLAKSLLRLVAKTDGHFTLEKADIRKNILSEIHYYFRGNYFRGLVVTLAPETSSAGNVGSTVELFFSSRRPSEFDGRILARGKDAGLEYFRVYTSYDVKEQISWNWSGLLSPTSSLLFLVSRWRPRAESAGNETRRLVATVWDSYGKGIAYSKLESAPRKSEDEQPLLFQEVELPSPHHPGWWSARLYESNLVTDKSPTDKKEDWLLLASTDFFVLPLELDGTDFENEDAANLYRVPKEQPPTPGPWGKSVPLENPVKTLSSVREKELEGIMASSEDSKKLKTLQDLVDLHVNEVFVFDSVCSVGTAGAYSDCTDTNWSTFYPDPKSDLNDPWLFEEKDLEAERESISSSTTRAFVGSRASGEL